MEQLEMSFIKDYNKNNNLSGELTFDKLNSIQEIFLSFTPDKVDLSRIEKYSAQFNLDFEKYDLKKIGDETYRAITLLTDYKRVASEFYEYAKLMHEKECSVAYFRRAPQFLKENEIKYSGSACEVYVDGDDICVKVKNIVNQWSILKVWIDDKRKDFLEKHLWVKKKIDELNNFRIIGGQS